MTPAEKNQILKDEIAHLAYLNWQKDGCPAGRDMNYWLEAESHLKATKHLHLEETGKASRTSAATILQKPKAKAARKTSARRELSLQH